MPVSSSNAPNFNPSPAFRVIYGIIAQDNFADISASARQVYLPRHTARFNAVSYVGVEVFAIFKRNPHALEVDGIVVYP